MRESIGISVLINVIIVFILVAFVFIAGTISYNRGFKANSKIVAALEKYEGYNVASRKDIELRLGSIGYNPKSSVKCAEKKGDGILVNDGTERYRYCIYKYTNEGSKYYSYGVTTYITIDFSMFGMSINLPIFSRTRRIYLFG